MEWTIPKVDPRLYLNVSHPFSTFICGSQGSGKSHTLSCILENCLIPSRAGRVPSPLTGLSFIMIHSLVIQWNPLVKQPLCRHILMCK
ncbi:hypothetical protein BDV41DRAFT_539835 [Aspergillus transmontanensis]|uniref:Uncharacterized protein n=1 Tax=Aspergillus transmontanensis TaxID=1034304 RepID=A0A5N6VYD1_9EURO|nr:hypothetical protein BDV41DRAFT_539835 [Aspergillus transmontanensis]